MTTLLPFRVHFDADEIGPFDTMASDAEDARKRAQAARPGALIRKIKLVRETAHA